MSRLPKDMNSILYRFGNQNSTNYRASAFDKLNVELDIKDIKYDHKIREQFNSTINQIDIHSAKILLNIENFLVDESWDNIKYDDVDYVNLLQLYLSEYTDPMQRFNDLIKYKTEYLLSDHYIKWFGSDLRRSLFVASLFERSLKSKKYQGEIELLEAVSDHVRYKHPIYNFQYKLPTYQLVSHIDFKEDIKSRHIELIKSTYFDNCVSDKDVKWIVPSDAEQIEWAYDYLEKEKRREKEKQNKKDGCIAEDEERDEENNIDEGGNEESYIPLKRVFFPQNTQEKYELILATIDRISNVENPPFSTNASGSYSERAYVLHKMQNAWNSRKGPSDKVISSNEVTVKLSKKSRDRLNKLPGNSKAEIDKFINKCIEEYVKKPS